MSLGSARSLVELLMIRTERTPHARAFEYPTADGSEQISWIELRDRVRALAGGLLAAGIERGDRCAILSSTRIEWILADLAILSAGGATATIYPANTADECEKILANARPRVVFVESPEQLAKLRSQPRCLDGVRKLVLIETGSAPDPSCTTLDELEADGRQHNLAHPDRLDEIARKLGPEDLATLIYTSGTTGEPKGVELVHDCWLAAAEAIDQLEIVGPKDLQYLWLPLSHSFGKVLVAAQLQVGFETFVDGRIPMLMENLPSVRPTFMAAAPRIFEKMYNRIASTMEHAGGPRLAIFRWAVGVAHQISTRLQHGEPIGSLLAVQRAVAEKLVFAPLRARFGGRFRFFVSGSAPLSKEIGEFFHGAGLVIIEGYGLTESSAIGASTTPRDMRFGTIGRAHPGVRARLAEDGELLLKGRVIMRGYHGLPEATREVLDPDGWLHTGDIAEHDPEGRLRITDRKKDLIKTSGGKYVAPQKLESRLKAACPYISQVVIHGNNRNFCTALITLDEDSIALWSKERGLESLPASQLAEREEVIELIQQAVDALNQSLASYETVKRFAVLPQDLTVEAGELTPSLKVKRRVVEERYRSVLDAFYRGSA